MFSAARSTIVQSHGTLSPNRNRIIFAKATAALKYVSTTTTVAANSSKDPGGDRVWLDGKSIADLSVKELKQSLDLRKISYSDCYDKESLQKRLATRLVNDQKTIQEIKKELVKNVSAEEEALFNSHVVDDRKIPILFLTAHIPWVPFGISKDVVWENSSNRTTDKKDLLLLVPAWEDERQEALFQREYNGIPDPQMAKQQLDILIQQATKLNFSLKNIEDSSAAPRMAKAASLLYRHCDKDKTIVHQVENLNDISYVQEHYTNAVPCFTPVPKNWMPEPSDRDMKNVMIAINSVRSYYGECEALEK